MENKFLIWPQPPVRLEPVQSKPRVERRGLRWWWVVESPYCKAELGPFWTRRGAQRAGNAVSGSARASHD